MNSVRIETGCRLHFGPLAVGAITGRRFGGVGAMLATPGISLTVTRSEVDRIAAPSNDIARRIEQFVARYRKNSAPLKSAPSFAIEVHQAIPAHQGLGSGTQLGISVATALSILHQEPQRSLTELATRVGRGDRSAIGLHGFVSGGFLVDAGKYPSQPISTLAAQSSIPQDWRWLLITPSGLTGLSGEQEVAAFRQLAPMSRELTAELCRITMMELLPALRQNNYAESCRAIGAFGNQVGDFFLPVQGDRFSHPHIRQIVNACQSRGFEGCGQSSWGPTVFVLCPSEEAAVNLQHELDRQVTLGRAEFLIAPPMNSGAIILGDGQRLEWPFCE